MQETTEHRYCLIDTMTGLPVIDPHSMRLLTFTDATDAEEAAHILGSHIKITLAERWQTAEPPAPSADVPPGLDRLLAMLPGLLSGDGMPTSEFVEMLAPLLTMALVGFLRQRESKARERAIEEQQRASTAARVMPASPTPEQRRARLLAELDAELEERRASLAEAMMRDAAASGFPICDMGETFVDHAYGAAGLLMARVRAMAVGKLDALGEVPDTTDARLALGLPLRSGCHGCG